MHLKTFLLAVASSLPVIRAVNLNLFWDIFDDFCDPTSAYAQCSDIGADTCCVYGSQFFSVQGTGLDTTGVPDVVAAFSGDTGQCGTACNSGGGNNIECVDCNTVLSGAMWYVFGSKRSVPGTILQTVQPDRVGLYDTALDAHRLFDISAGVPSDVIAELDSALKNNTRVEHLSDAVLFYEVQ